MVSVHSAMHHSKRHEPGPATRAVVSEPAGKAYRVDCEPLFSFAGRPGGVAVDAYHTVYLSELDSGSIWQVSPDGTGNAVVGTDAGTDRLYSPAGIALAPDGSLVVADATAHRVCAVGMEGSIRVVAGGASGYRDGPAGQAAFRFPRAVAVGADGSIFVADSGNDQIRQISPDGQVTTLAGSGFDYGDGEGDHARFRRPSGLAIDSFGALFVADTGNNAIRRVSTHGEVTTVAGSPPGGNHDGAGPAIRWRWPSAIAVDEEGWLWVSDFGNGKVRVIDPTRNTFTVLEIPGLAWPAAVAAVPGRRAVVAGEALNERLDRHGCLMVINDPH